MLAAVQFDDEPALLTDEICDIGSDGNLSAELEAVELAVAHMPPDDRFRIRLVPPQRPCPHSQNWNNRSRHLAPRDTT